MTATEAVTNSGAGAQWMQRIVGVVVPYEIQRRQNLTDPFMLAIVGALADALTERGYEMLLLRVDTENLESIEDAVRIGKAIGILLIGQWNRHALLNELADRHLPFVVWGGRMPDQRYCTVGSDNVLGGLLATRHLLTLGRRRIAFLGDTALPEVALRHEGYRRAHEAVGLNPDPGLCIAVDFTARQTEAAARELAQRRPQPDAMFACSDLLATSAITALYDLGVSVPDDISVVGYDDMPLAAHYFPPLTTVRQPLAEAARVMVDRLLTMREGGKAESVVLPTELVIRETTGPAAFGSREPNG